MSEPKNSQKRKPRNVRAAAKRGWHIVDISAEQYYHKHNLSFLGLLIVVDKFAQGKYVNRYDPNGKVSQFAFENEADAAWFIMKFL